MRGLYEQHQALQEDQMALDETRQTATRVGYVSEALLHLLCDRGQGSIVIDWQGRASFIEKEATQFISSIALSLPDSCDVGRHFVYTNDDVRCDALKTAALFWELLFNS